MTPPIEGFLLDDHKYREWGIVSYINGGVRRYEDLLSRLQPSIKDYKALVLRYLIEFDLYADILARLGLTMDIYAPRLLDKMPLTTYTLKYLSIYAGRFLKYGKDVILEELQRPLHEAIMRNDGTIIREILKYGLTGGRT